MKIQTLGLLALVPAAILTFSSCSTEESEPAEAPRGMNESKTTTEAGVPGGTMVRTYRVTATVTGINTVDRQLTLVAPDGAKTTVDVSPDVVNFPQIAIGDVVKAKITAQLVVFVRKPGEPSNDSVSGMVALAPVGAKPSGVVARTHEVTATLQSVDLAHRKAMLMFPDGTSKSFEVRKDVDLTKYDIGTPVVFQTTDAIAISVEKP
jgi:hypothetical protein